MRTGKTAPFAYPLTDIGTAGKPNYPTISDIVAVNDHEFLLGERDGKGLGDDSTAKFKQLYHVDISGAQDVSQASGESDLPPYAIKKTLFLDVVKAVTAYGFKPADIPAKIESLAFGPDVRVRGRLKHTLFIANDNDFLGTEGHESPGRHRQSEQVLRLRDRPRRLARLCRATSAGREGARWQGLPFRSGRSRRPRRSGTRSPQITRPSHALVHSFGGQACR
ncbi:esterase-like activity of phytase family protein [Caballeronia catudaia]|uniref:esterase-like activity of phytase family protein n=1 Tax=Caballeronia catudaia TaxID=1777136 RepID=UPI0007729552|nr:esterase-like activity of phytase family protein [Caballeronia catudaia]